MLIKADAAQLEWRVKVFLAQDQVAMKEIINAFDTHTDNQTRFNLPSRLIAKIFLFRLIFADAFGDRGYAGPAWTYANDADFRPTSADPKFWEKVIEQFFEKYPQVREHSVDCIRQAINVGRLVIPTGRYYEFTQVKKYNGRYDWPRATILNYPVQGFAGDIMRGVRAILRYRLEKAPWGKYVLLINTVHDSIEADVPNDPDLIVKAARLMEGSFRDVDRWFKKNYDFVLNVPMAGETKVGMSLYEKDMIKLQKYIDNGCKLK